MTKIRFYDHPLNKTSIALIERCEEVINDLEEQGYKLTLRQLYYQLVARNIVSNTPRSYKNLSVLITKAREAGLLSWDSIEDRGRSCVDYSFNEDKDSVFDGLGGLISFDLWSRMDHYVEVWVEKDAQVGIVARPCEKLLVPYLACKGYLSASEAYNAGQRFRQAVANGKIPVMIHLGDHDPSGLDMTRDNGERLEVFSGGWIKVERIALNKDQIKKYNPPPNPAKIDDPRADKYIEEHGDQSWELDALAPQVIDELITKTVSKYIDTKIWNKALAEEKVLKKKLRYLPEFSDQIWEMLDDRHAQE